MKTVSCSNRRCTNKMLVPENDLGLWFCSTSCAEEMMEEPENYSLAEPIITDVAMPNLLEEARKHFNEPVLISFRLARVIGYAEDDEDCYLIYQSPYDGTATIDGKGPVAWCTFVGGYTWLTSLKEQGITIPNHPSYPGEIWTDYSRLDSSLALNGCPKADQFLIVKKTVQRISVK